VSYDVNQRFLALVPGGNGIFYAIQADGNLLWYRHSGWTNGAATRSAGGGSRVIGSGRNLYPWRSADPDGVIYCMGYGGDLSYIDEVTGQASRGSVVHVPARTQWSDRAKSLRG
jgi:tachylectin